MTSRLELELTLDELKALYARHGVKEMLAKELSANDNSKNQIYLGSSFSIINELPVFDVSVGTGSEARNDRHNNLKASLNFSWLDEQGNLWRAPSAQLILYPQYPEVRLSGVLAGAKRRPSHLVNPRMPGRILILGRSSRNEVIASIFHPASPVSEEVRRLAALDGIFVRISITEDSRERLLLELQRVWKQGWIRSWKLSPSGEREPCEHRNCGGYTLEAELGVRPSGKSEPDFLDWELKQYGGGVITLLTPEPTGGFYTETGKEAFVRRFGWPHQGNPGRLNFSTPHRVGVAASARSPLLLRLEGFDPSTGNFAPDGAIRLRDPSDEICAEWSFASLVEKWSRKHSKTAFVPSECEKSPQRYRYGPIIQLGLGTDFSKFLQSLNDGVVAWDPALKLEAKPGGGSTLKARNQFRMKSGQLERLYHSFETINLEEL